MIRDFKKDDLDRVMEVWLEGNISAHSFIDREYWKGNYDTTAELIQSGTTYVYEENNIVQGFIGLGDNYIGALFIDSDMRSKGIGKKLMDYVKDKYDTLSLGVYADNVRAVEFYLREQFTVSGEHINEKTGKTGLSMNWTK